MSEPCVHSLVFDDCLSCQQSALVRCDKELTTLRAERDALRKVADAARTFHNAWAHPLPASGAIQQEFADDLFYALETLTHPHRGEPVSEQRVSDEHLRRFIERNDGRHEGTLILGLAKDLRDARAGAAGMISKRRELPPRDRHEITMLNWFRFHPATPVTGPQHDLIRSLFRHLAAELIRSLPGGPDQTIALRKLQEAMMAANACIANNQTEDTPALNPASVDSNG